MGWQIGFDENWQRDIGYGVPAICDHPGCTVEIDRGLGFVCCDQQPYGGEDGCGLYFCSDHRALDGRCQRCIVSADPFEPKPDAIRWVRFKLEDASWAQWRQENPTKVETMRKRVHDDRLITAEILLQDVYHRIPPSAERDAIRDFLRPSVEDGEANGPVLLRMRLGRPLFEFRTFDDWVNNAKRRFEESRRDSRTAICIDTKGRICGMGREFMRARDEGTFPVTVYLQQPDDTR